jgi:divalent metal cation (Fe/Co/Zn/Cd) transporter
MSQRLIELEPHPPGSACDESCSCCARETSVLQAQDPRLRRWAWGLTALTIGWNSIEAIVALTSGVLASSIALIGFGLDSIVEVSSALVIVWRLARQSEDHEANERSEKRAVRLIALSFFGITAYVVYDAATKVLGIGEHPEQSSLGLALVVLSLIVMPVLAWGKRRVAAGLHSVALRADAAETQLCTYLSAVVLLGLGANSLLGWWWMDPVAGLVVAAIALREGREAWASGELCC